MTFAHLTPKLATVLREGYGLAQWRVDLVAGLTVAVVALPLSMAIAIASHATPAAGLVSAIVGGFLISALGGSRFQIGGPAGAFIVLVASIIDTHGFDGLLLATMMAGMLMLVAGLLRVGELVRLVPHTVIVGFSSGIAIIIFATQLRDLGGLRFAGLEPAALIPKLDVLWAARSSINWHSLAISSSSIAIIVLSRWISPRIPGFLIAVVVASGASWWIGLDVETIGSRFGGIPSGLSMPRLPEISWDRVWLLLPSAFSLALLGAIESLLSAVVADTMKGRRHRSNAELLAQGIANIATPMFGGITTTGTIARTATNVRAGAHGPVSGMLHAIFILLFMMFAAPALIYVPLAALAGILAVVSWNMFERREFMRLMQSWLTATVLLVTIAITIFHDLLWGIMVGSAMHAMLSLFARSSDRMRP